jgi:lysozyme family protein
MKTIEFDENFKKSLKFTLKWEGGYSNYPDDPGGETNFGISKRHNPEVDVKNLTKEKAASIYFLKYWLKSGADKVAWPACLVMFETAVNPGPARLAKFLIGTEGLSAIELSKVLLQKRIAYYQSLQKRYPLLYKKNIKGWLNRVNSLKKYGEI